MKIYAHSPMIKSAKRTSLALMSMLAVTTSGLAQQNDTAKILNNSADSLANTKNIIFDTTPKQKTIPDYDISLRTFQVMDGANITAIGVGSGIHKDFTKNGALQLYGTALAGYNSRWLQPCIGGFGVIDYTYPNQQRHPVKLSVEAYGELMASKDNFDSKVTLAPIKVNANLGKDVFLSFAPRLALHFMDKTVKPMVETFTSLNFPLSKKNKKISGAVQFRTTDMITHEFGAKNLELRAGIKYKF